MITLYCDPRSRECQSFNETLNELSVGHRMIGVTDKAPSAVSRCGGQLPALLDGQEICCGARDVQQRLSGLREPSKGKKGEKEGCECEGEGFTGDDWSSG